MSKQSELSDVMNDGRSLVYGAFMGMSRPPLTHDEERFRSEIRVEVADRVAGKEASDFADPYMFIAPPPPSAELVHHGNSGRGWPAAITGAQRGAINATSATHATHAENVVRVTSVTPG